MKSKIDFHAGSIIMLHSTLFYVLAYLLVYFFKQLIMAFAASLFGMSSLIYHNSISYVADYSDWYQDAVVTIFSSGPIFSFIFFMVIYIIQYKVIEMNGLLKILFIWMFIHSADQFFGSAFVGAFSDEGFGYVFSWLYFMDTNKLLIVLLSLFGLITAGTMAVKPFVFSANCYFNQQNQLERKKFMFLQVLIPFVLGTLIIGLLKYPGYAFEHLEMLLMVIPIGTVMLIPYSLTDIYFDEAPRKNVISKQLVIAFIIIVVLFRIGLSFGLRIPAIELVN